MIFKNTLAVVSLTILMACNAKNKEISPPVKTLEAATVQGNFSAPTTKYLDSLSISRFIDSFPLLKEITPDLQNFYQGRNYSYAWFTHNGMIEQAGNLYNKIKNVEEEGVDSSKLFYQQEFSNYMDYPYEPAAENDSSLLMAELMLTAQYLQYAKTVWVGLKEKESLALQWLLPRKKISYTQTLDSLLSGKDVLANPPVYMQYYLLKDYLKKYRLAEKADTVKIPITRSPLKKGDSSYIIAAARYKLFLLGDIKEYMPLGKFDEGLDTAVRKFQARMGFGVTGKLAKAEIDELNISIHQRVEALLVNMERCRWVTNNNTKTYLIVNIPEFKLHAIQDNALLWSMNVVVGKNQHKTVVFNGNIKYVVFSPYWNIPYNIIKNETLPALRKNPSYLKRHNMEWIGNSIRQKPGPNNSLGLVKFLFPNSHSIYLHDTPAKSLFKETNRAFSHGCIRVSEPQKLAAYLLKNDTTWNEKNIRGAMNSGKERTVTLREPMPVFIAYFTSWVASDGSLNFRRDIYERDQKLLSMIVSQ